MNSKDYMPIIILAGIAAAIFLFKDKIVSAVDSFGGGGGAAAPIAALAPVPVTEYTATVKRMGYTGKATAKKPIQALGLAMIDTNRDVFRAVYADIARVRRTPYVAIPDPKLNLNKLLLKPREYTISKVLARGY
jgi:hypothetical protein